MSRPLHDLPLHQHAKYLARVKSRLDGNLVLPHTIESGDPYYIGDVYNQLPPPSTLEWQVDTTNRPYLRHLKALSSAWPSVKYLADWMEVTTSPIKWSLMKHRESDIRSERAKRTKVAIVDFDCSSTSLGNTSVRRIDDTDALSQALRAEAVLNDKACLFIVEDLSRDVVELLGGHFDINPLFFRDHISDYSWYNTRDRWVELPDLMRVSDARNFFTLRYLQARYFESRESFEAATRQAAFFNVLRRLDEDKNHTAILDADDACVALVRSKASFWFQTAQPGKSGAIGILLVDPTVTEGYPLWAAQPNFEEPPSMFHAGPFEALPKSVLDSVVHWARRMSHADIASISSNPVVMATGIAHLVCAEWLRLCRYIPTRLEQVEWEIQNPDFRLDPNGIDSSLSKLYPWRRWLPLYRTMLGETMLKLFRGSSPALNNSLSTLKQDFCAIETTIDGLQHRIDKIVAVITAIISIEESRRAITQNQYIGRLTYLAMIFAPLSFVSSFFSMATDLAALKETFWIYFCVALPVSLLVFLLVNKEVARSWLNMLKTWSRRWG